MDLLSSMAVIAGEITCIAALLTMLIRPLRERLFTDRDAREGQRCLLRSEIVSTYYRHLDDKKIRQYEYENMLCCYKAYKAMKGNSFIDHIYEEMREWEVIY
jgi:hypothetical protein